MRIRRPRKGKRNVEQGTDVAPENVQSPIVQDSLLLNLPSEVRVLILRNILSQHTIHLSAHRFSEGAQFGWPQGRTKPIKPRINSRWCSRDCPLEHDYDDDASHSGAFPGGQAMRLLLVSRQIYLEALEIVFSSNVFSFGDLLIFGDFAAQFPVAIKRIQVLHQRHEIPRISPPSYTSIQVPAGLRLAVQLSWDGPAMLAFFAGEAMSQLREMRIELADNERSDYAYGYIQIHAAWLRYIAQLARYVGQPDFIRMASVKGIAEPGAVVE
jgi:hypothetical protein